MASNFALHRKANQFDVPGSRNNRCIIGDTPACVEATRRSPLAGPGRYIS